MEFGVKVLGLRLRGLGFWLDGQVCTGFVLIICVV